MLSAALALQLVAATLASAQEFASPGFRFQKSPDVAPAADDEAFCANVLDSAAPPSIDREPPRSPRVAAKLAARGFPSVFQAWRAADGMDAATSLAKRDLAWMGIDGLLKGDSRWLGLSTRFEPRPAAAALRAANPDGILLAEIRWREAAPGYLPDDHPWWRRDRSRAGSQLQPSGRYGGRQYYFLEHRDECLQRQAARQCKAAIAAGFDGCLLDCWPDADRAQLDMLRMIREAIGPDALLMVNSNGKIPAESMPYINGVYAEGFGSPFWTGRPAPPGGLSRIPYPPDQDWQKLIDNLRALRGVRSPRINAIEGWGDPSDARHMRALTTAVLAYSDASVLFARPQSHAHPWQAFWDKGLGRPLSQDEPAPLGGGAVRREFEGGTVVFNRSPAPAVVSFPQPRVSRATGTRAARFAVPARDGDIFLK